MSLGGGELGVSASFSGNDTGLGATLKVLSRGLEVFQYSAAAAKEKLGVLGTTFKESFAILKSAHSAYSKLEAFSDESKGLRIALRSLKVFGGAGKEELDKVRDAATSGATALLGFGANEAATAMQKYGRITGDAANATQGLAPALQLARLAGAGAADGAEALARTVERFRLKASEGAQVTDVLAFSMKNMRVQEAELLPGLAALGVAGTRTGASFQDSALAALIAGRALGSFEAGANSVGAAVTGMTKVSAKGIKDLSKDGTGGFNGILDVFEKMLKKTPEVATSQTALAQAAFAAAGPRGAQGLQNIMAGLNRIMLESPGKYANATEALAGLRAALKESGGEGAKTAAALTGTGTQITATWESIRTGASEAVKKSIISPVEKAFLNISQLILTFVNSIPQDVKNSLAAAVGFGLKMFAAFGAFIAAKAAIILIATALKMIPAIIIGVIVAFGPLIAQFLLAVAVFEAFKLAYEENLGGFRDLFTEIGRVVSLVWRGLMQAFGKGELSGAVLTELELAKNKGILKFVLDVYAIGEDLKGIWEGFSGGFKKAIQRFEPTFALLTASFWSLVRLFTGGSADITTSIADVPFQKWLDFGAKIGNVIGLSVGVVVTALTYMMSFMEGGWKVLLSILDTFSPTFKDLWKSLKDLGSAFGGIFVVLGTLLGATNGTTSGFQIFGGTIGGLVGVALTALAEALNIVVGVITLLVTWVKAALGGVIGFGTAIGNIIGLFVNWGKAVWDLLSTTEPGMARIVGLYRVTADLIKGIFLEVFDYLRDQFDRMLILIAKSAKVLPSFLRTKGLNSFIAEQDQRESELDSGLSRSVLRSQAPARRQLDAEQAALADEAFLAPLANPGAAALAALGPVYGPEEIGAAVGDKINKQPIEITNITTIDGDVVSEIIKRIERDQADASYE